AIAVRVAVIQMPRPGNLRFMSGTTSPAGPTTKRTNSEVGLTSRVNAQVRSVAAGTFIAPRSSSPSSAFARLVGPPPSGLGLCRLFSRFFGGWWSELGFRDPASLQAGLHNHGLGVLA